MTDEELIALDKMGFIPGPGESEESFLMRVGKTQKTFAEGNWIPDAHWAWVREYLGQLFDVKPLYICAFYSNHRLAPWQGGAAWIDGKALSAIQLRENLRKGSYLGIYRREEILAHEAVHAARSGFNENRCEEFFAYMTSEKKWRRILGPIVQSPWEVWPFLLGALLGAVWPIGYLVAGVWAGLGFFRLIKQHLRLRRASLNLLKEVGKAEIARAVLFRLTDREIKQLSQGVSIHLLCDKQTDLRGRVIRNYLKEGLWQKESS